MKDYRERVEIAKNKCLEKMLDTVERLEYGSTEQKIAGVLHDELKYTLPNISDAEEYFSNLKNIFSTFEDFINEYNYEVDEIEKDF